MLEKFDASPQKPPATTITLVEKEIGSFMVAVLLQLEFTH